MAREVVGRESVSGDALSQLFDGAQHTVNDGIIIHLQILLQVTAQHHNTSNVSHT